MNLSTSGLTVYPIADICFGHKRPGIKGVPHTISRIDLDGDVWCEDADGNENVFHPHELELYPGRPRVVCLCGSTRFYTAFQEANYRETMAGNIVLTVGFYPHAADRAHGEELGVTPEQKVALDELHKRKIDMCDEVFVVNVGGYVGESTRSEIAYAKRIGKPVRYLETNA